MKKIFIIIVLFLTFIFNLGKILDLTTEPITSDIIVVFGGAKYWRIVKGLNLYLQNYSTTNKIILPNKEYSKLVLKEGFSYDFIIKNNIIKSNILYLNHVSNTMEELLEIKKYLKENNLNKVIFISHPTHSLRIKLLANIIADYEKDNIQINFVSADDTKVWNKQYYFLEWQSIKLVFLELIKIPYNLIKYTIFL
ncbi:YdcF family protein [Arcobacter sp. s6]|uniref:YdcF family protein n=1 Tax=Arcobacter sp. s6 TaxID=3230363 RepID=UPI0034A0A043